MYTVQPNKGDSTIVTLVNDAIGRSSTQHQLYQVVKGRTSGKEMTVKYVDGRPETSHKAQAVGASVL